MRSLMPKWVAIMALSSLAIVSYGTYQRFTAPEAAQQSEVIANNDEDDEEKIKDITLQDYFWLDSIPENAYTPFNSYVFADGMGINSQFASTFKVTIELFEYRDGKGTLRFDFPHDNRSAKCNYTISAYSNPKYPFLTAQLTLSGDPQFKGKEKTYYTGPDLHLNSRGSSLPQNVQASLASVRAQLAASSR